MTTASVHTLRPLEPVRAAGPALHLRVAVQGGDVLTRVGLRTVLDSLVDVQVEHVEVERPADLAQAEVVVVVLDVVTARAVDAVRGLAARAGCRPVLVVGEVGTEALALVVRAGAVGVLRRREATVESVGALLHAVASGEAVVPVDLLTSLLPRTAEHATPAAGTAPAARTAPAPATSSAPGVAPAPGAGSPARTGLRTPAHPALSDRERAVLQLLGDGADTREIARRLSYSERTVKVVVQDLTRRFGVRNRTHAVAYAVRQGLI